MKKYYNNPLRRQVFSLRQLAPVQLEHSINAFITLFPKDLIARIDRLVLTGCGDSYLAAMECRGAFKKYVKGCRVEAVRAIDAARYISLGENEPNTMIVAISASGATGRIAEILERGKKHNCVTVALTNNGKSRAAKTADYTYLTDTPFFPNDNPGLRSYFASLISLTVMAAIMGEIRGKISFLPELKEKLLEYHEIFFEKINQIDSSCLEVSQKWEEKKGFEVIADGPMFWCGEFVAAKYAEVSGDMCTVIDSENYCHVNGLIRPGEAVGTIVMAASDEANMGRVADTIARQVQNDCRSVLLICDKELEQSGVSVEYCSLPVPERNFRFLLPLYAYIPGTLMAGYRSEIMDEPYFRGDEILFKPENMTINNNAMKVI